MSAGAGEGPASGPDPGRGLPGRVPAWAAAESSSFSWTDAVGGWRGAAESVVPGLVFVVLFVATRDLRLCLIAAAAAALAFCAVRLVQHQTLTQALSGLVGVAIGVAWAALSGRGENYFAWGLVTASFFAVVLLVSMAARRPLVAIVLGWVWELPGNWPSDPVLAPLRRRALALTWLWAAMFLVRLGVQWPLWRAGAVAELGVAKLVLGLPLFAVVCWLTWAGLRPFTALARATRGVSDDPAPDAPGH